jgi:hypothetical protein
LGSQCTSYLQQHKLVLTCVAWGADRKDAVLHNTSYFASPVLTLLLNTSRSLLLLRINCLVSTMNNLN